MPKPVWIDDNTLKCSICSEEKPKEKFTFSTSKTRPEGYYFSYCKSCRASKQKTNRSHRVFSWQHKVGKVKQSAINSGVDFDLTAEYLEFLYKKQKGLCVYTQQPMRLSRVGRYTDSVSVDQIIPMGGYVPGNVVLCLNRANSIKQDQTLEELAEWMPLWHTRLMKFIEELEF